MRGSGRELVAAAAATALPAAQLLHQVTHLLTPQLVGPCRLPCTCCSCAWFRAVPVPDFRAEIPSPASAPAQPRRRVRRQDARDPHRRQTRHQRAKSVRKPLYGVHKCEPPVQPPAQRTLQRMVHIYFLFSEAAVTQPDPCRSALPVVEPDASLSLSPALSLSS